MNRYLLTAALAAIALAGAPAMAATVDFDSGAQGTPVGAFYASLGVTFSNAVFAASFGLPGTTGPGAVASQSSGFAYTYASGDAISGSFSGAVGSISLVAADLGAAGIRLEAYDAANVLIASDEAYGTDIGVGNFETISVSAPGIVGFRFYQPGFDGLDGVVVDTFTFDDIVGGGVPEPATWAMMIGGIGAVGGAARRRKAKLSVHFA